MRRIILVCCLLTLFLPVLNLLLVAQLMAAYPDPPADIIWSGTGTHDVANVQAAFNHARAVENTQLGTSLPPLTLSSQSAWNVLSDGQKALWLINRERLDRGVKVLSGVESNVTGVAQAYAQYLIDHNKFGHFEDGHDPLYRLRANPVIAACIEGYAENIAYSATSSTSIPIPLETAVYWFMYEDSGSAWGHRHNILKSWNDNSGPAGQEGFLGVGVAAGSPYMGYHYGEVVVMDFFDPCATWNYNPIPPTYSNKVYLPLVIK
jgi:uncharacterized protein YkwD